jgi:putative PIG3 family NAD(P)H quinone oxidoreductase
VRAVTVPTPGGPEVLTLADVPDPQPAAGEVVVDVVATAVNRADLLQRMGFYPPPPGASDILGLECSGTIRALGPEVTGWSVGDEVCALLAGGGYAEQVVVPAGQLMRVPAGVPLAVAGALPEVACTVWANVFMVAHLSAGETLLVHGGAGGIGTFAIQLANALDARVFATAGSEEKLELCRTLGAERAISYRDEAASGAPLWVEVLREAGGADVILDNMGAAYLDHNVAALAPNGRVAIIGMQGGTKGELDVSALMRKRGALIAATLRARPTAEKAAICRAVEEHVWPLVEAGTVRPIVSTEIALADVAEAHTLMDAGGHTGKILLRVGSAPTRRP